MSMVTATPAAGAAVGPLLQRWRRARQLSQLGLASEAGISARHLCFVETGRAKPSREMVLLLAETLDVPLRERNGLLLAAGFAPEFSEATLEAPELEVVRRALDAMLQKHEPLPAVVMNRHWDIVRTNQAAAKLFGFLLAGQPLRDTGNVLRLMFHPDGLRPFVVDWPAVAESLLRRVRREALGGLQDEVAEQLLREILAYPEIPTAWGRRAGHLTGSTVPIIPVRFRRGDVEYHFFSAVTTLGTPQDVTAQELRIECFFPADDATSQRAQVELSG
jgi:transcriptional regulator with XRE-family HTH domain